jgi:shikimate dehydrogenase
VLGSPVTHSRSPELHRAAYAALGLDWTYEVVDMTEDGLPAFVRSLGPEWVGLSLTMPLKSVALTVAGDVGTEARETGVANTLVRRGRTWVAHNTDAPGLRRALSEADVPAGGTACVLGGGATARSSIWALADHVERVQVLARSPRRSVGLTVLALPVRVEVRSLEDPAARRAGLAADLVVDTTPARAVDWVAAEVPAGAGTFVDWTYATWPTTLATAYAEAGRAVVGGLELLVHQAALQVELVTGQPAPIAAMRAALAEVSE